MIKLKVFILWLLFLVLTMWIGNTYRPYIYSNHINDYGLADVGYNPIAVVNMTLLRWLGVCRFSRNKVLDIFINTIAYLFFELTSYFIPLFGVFDIKDALALIFSCLLSVGMMYVIDKKGFKYYARRLYVRYIRFKSSHFLTGSIT